jgi:hypothetical protein
LLPMRRTPCKWFCAPELRHILLSSTSTIRSAHRNARRAVVSGLCSIFPIFGAAAAIALRLVRAKAPNWWLRF